MASPLVPSPRVIGPRPFWRVHQRAGLAGPGHVHLVTIPGALPEKGMTDLLASLAQKTPAIKMHWQWGGGRRVKGGVGGCRCSTRGADTEISLYSRSLHTIAIPLGARKTYTTSAPVTRGGCSGVGVRLCRRFACAVLARAVELRTGRCSGGDVPNSWPHSLSSALSHASGLRIWYCSGVGVRPCRRSACVCTSTGLWRLPLCVPVHSVSEQKTTFLLGRRQ